MSTFEKDLAFYIRCENLFFLCDYFLAILERKKQPKKAKVNVGQTIFGSGAAAATGIGVVACDRERAVRT
jgi:hypothetical protein